MEYVLQPSKTKQRATALRRIIPPRPKPGERGARPYSHDDLDALYATSHALKPQALVSLVPPPNARIATWDELKTLLLSFKSALRNFRERHGYPSALFATEFDPVDRTEPDKVFANFHVVFASPLSSEQESRLRAWWLDKMRLANNQGRSFDYKADGGGERLADYVAKDITKRKGAWRFVKFPAPWLPQRIETRLWFAVGAKRRPAREGAVLWKQKGRGRRRRFEREQGNSSTDALSARTASCEREQGSSTGTADFPSVTLAPLNSGSVTTSSCFPIPESGSRQECPTCRTRWGRSLWIGFCKCTGHVH